jgi:hypothetical protein
MTTLKIYTATDLYVSHDIVGMVGHASIGATVGSHQVFVAAESKAAAACAIADATMNPTAAGTARKVLRIATNTYSKVLIAAGLLSDADDVVIIHRDGHGNVVQAKGLPGRDPEIVGRWDSRRDEDGYLTRTLVTLDGTVRDLPDLGAKAFYLKTKAQEAAERAAKLALTNAIDRVTAYVQEYEQRAAVHGTTLDPDSVHAFAPVDTGHNAFIELTVTDLRALLAAAQKD